MLRLQVLALSVCLSSLASAAFAQGESPQATTATYRDWTLRCANLATEPLTRACEVAQAIRDQGGQNVLAQIVIGRAAADQPVRLIVQVPPGVWLPSNVQLNLGGATIATAVYKSCQQVCFADVELAEDTIAALKAAGEAGRLVLADGAQRVIELPVSFNGFTAAFDASQQP